MKIKTIITIMALTAASVPTFGQGLKSGIPLDNLDRTARPGDDFYQFACGGWVKNNPLPSAYSRFGSFDQLQQDNNERINGILTELQRNQYAQYDGYYQGNVDEVFESSDYVFHIYKDSGSVRILLN